MAWSTEGLAAAGFVIDPNTGKPVRIAPHASTRPPVASPGAQKGKVPRRTSKARTTARSCPTEDEEQALLFSLAASNEWRYPELRLLFAIPNGGFRHKATAARMKKTGTVSGVPDVCLPVARTFIEDTDPDSGGYMNGVTKHALYLELKRTKGGRVSTDQTQWLKDLREAGNAAVVCRGGQAAFEALVNYLEGREIENQE